MGRTEVNVFRVAMVAILAFLQNMLLSMTIDTLYMHVYIIFRLDLDFSDKKILSRIRVLTFAKGHSCIQKVIAIYTQDKDLLDNSHIHIHVHISY